MPRSLQRITLTLLIFSMSLPLTAQSPAGGVQTLLTEIEKLIGEKKPDLVDLKIKRTQLEDYLSALNSAAIAAGASQAAKDLNSKANAVFKEAQEKIKDIEDPDILAFIKSAKPLTAVLVSTQARNSFEVVKDPLSTDDTIGIINQNQAGGTGGILLAAEALFAQPRVKGKWFKSDTGEKARMPIGAWFGVNLKTGGGDDVSDVDLAVGLSISFLSANRQARLKEQDKEFGGAARLLVGVVYGEVASLGPKDATSRLNIGDPYPLGESPPLSKDKKISATFGIGFRF